MAWTDLPTNFINLVWSGLKKYRQYNNPDDTVSFEDVTEYVETEGTQMSAAQLNQMTGAVNQLMTGIASEFSTSTSYAIGDYCMYEGQLYRFTSAHSAGAWNSSHVTSVSKITDEIRAKAPIVSPGFSGTPTAPTAAIGTNNTQIATTAFVTSHDVFKITGSVSASNYTLTDSRINNEHWEVDTIYFETPSNVTSKVHWTTNITNHTVSLSATYAGSTNVVVKMHWVQ